MDTLAHLLNSSLRLVDSAMSDPRARFASGRLVRLRRGFYVPTSVWLEAPIQERFSMAVGAYARANPQAIFCGETALFLHGLPVVKAPPFIDVAIPSTAKLGVRPETFAIRGATDEARRAALLPPPSVRRHQHALNDVVAVGEFRTVPITSALVEVLATARFARALTAADGMLRPCEEDALLRLPDIDSPIAVIRQRTRRRRVEVIAGLARRGAESPGESVSRALMLLFGFLEPDLQREHRDPHGLIGRTDSAWDLGLEPVGEFDGWGKYFRSELTGCDDPRDVIRREKRRENRLLVAGHPVLRWDWADLERPQIFRARLLEGRLHPDGSHLLAEKFA